MESNGSRISSSATRGRRHFPLRCSFVSSSSLSLLIISIFFIFSSSSFVSAVKIERHLAVEGETATFVASGGGAWIRLPQQNDNNDDDDKKASSKNANRNNLAFQMLSSDGQNPIDDSIDKKKFNFEKLPNNRYVILVYDCV